VRINHAHSVRALQNVEQASSAAALIHAGADDPGDRGSYLAWPAAIQQREDELRQSLETQNQLFATVRELSTPILPVADGVIVLPLIDHIDTRRAQDITPALLWGVASERARVAILHITGVAASILMSWAAG
jgi:hypothetical protein